MAGQKGAEAATNFADAYAKYLNNNQQIENAMANKGSKGAQKMSEGFVGYVKKGGVADSIWRWLLGDETVDRLNREGLFGQWKSSGSGGSGWADGGYTGSGDKYEVAGVVHKGEYVLPREMVNQSTGTPKAIGGNITINVSGVFATSDAEKRNVALQIANALQQVQKSRLGA